MVALKQRNRLLDRFPVIRTDDVDDMRDAIGGFYGEVRLSVDSDFQGFRAHGNHCQLNFIGISYATYEATVHHYYPSLSSHYTIPLAAAGAGWGRTGGRAFDIDHRRSLIGSPGLPGELHVGPDFEELTVQLDAAAVQRTLASLIGAEVNGSLSFDPVVDLEKTENRLWFRLLRFLIAEAETRGSDLPVAALGEIEQALIVMFLKANRHNFSSVLEDLRHERLASVPDYPAAASRRGCTASVPPRVSAIRWSTTCRKASSAVAPAAMASSYTRI